MNEVFLKILNMSITASWLILAVLLARLLLVKAPKWTRCLLWGLVAVRLILPVSLQTAFSLIPSSETIPADIAVQPDPAIRSGITIVNQTVNPILRSSFTPAPSDSVNPLQVWIALAAAVWIAGVAAMLLYAFFSFLILKRRVRACVPIGGRARACDEVRSPFILGVFKPVIYVPSSLCEEALEHVLEHENAHLSRRDHWWKPLGYLLLSVYWFNPLCWLAYILLCRDIEMACDEKVVRAMDREKAAAYSQALLDCSRPRRSIAACPLAFGEVGVKQRIKGILNYKKPAFWIVVAAAVVAVGLAVFLMTDPFAKKDPAPETAPVTAEPETLAALREKFPEYFGLDTMKGLEVYVWQMAPEVTRCGLLSGTNREKTYEELIALKHATLEEMQAILSTYDVPDEMISVVGYQHLLSSYVPPDVGYLKEFREKLLEGRTLTVSLAGKAHLVRLGWTDGEAIARNALNADLPANDARLPVYRFDTASDARLAVASFAGASGFEEAIAAYGDDFYAENSLIAAYLCAPSGSFRYAVRDLTVRNGAFCMAVYQSNDPESYTDDMAAWLVLAEVSDRDLEGCTSFDARLVSRPAGTVEELFEIIMSSPSYSSVTGDYLNAHEKEHQALLASPESTLRYIFSQFLDEPEQNGLKGQLMIIILSEIEPDPSSEGYITTGTQEYFEQAWRQKALTLRKDHGDEWLRENHPAKYLLVTMLDERN